MLLGLAPSDDRVIGVWPVPRCAPCRLFDRSLLTRSTLPAAIVLLLDAIYPVPSQRTTFALVIERCAAVERLLSPLRAATYRGSTAAVLKSLASVDELLRDTTRAAEAAQAAEQAELEQARQAKLSAIVAPPIDVYGPGGMMMGVGGTTAASGGDQTLGGMLHDLDFGKCLGGGCDWCEAYLQNSCCAATTRLGLWTVFGLLRGCERQYVQVSIRRRIRSSDILVIYEGDGEGCTEDILRRHYTHLLYRAPVGFRLTNML